MEQDIKATLRELHSREMIDVVDENGIKTGVIKSRTQVHIDGDWHRIAMICIVNNKNKILLQQRSESVDKFPGLWDLSVASHVQSGNDSISTAVKETNEEIGLQIEYEAKVKDFRFLTSFRNSHVFNSIIENQYYDLFILRKQFSVSNLKFNDSEVQAAKWADYTEIKALLKGGKLHPRTEWIDEVFNYIHRF